jgi:NADPH2:quinone reductase
MKALELQQATGPEGLTFVERPDLESDVEVVIEVRAAGVSFPDLLLTEGLYQERPSLPTVPGLEVAGVVRSAPPDATVAAGDRVWAALQGGGYASLAAAPLDRVFPLAPDLSFVQGAALPVNFLTAVFALRRRAALAVGESILILGGGGGLGTALVAVASRMGARVLASVSSEAKAEAARAAGADEIVVGKEWRTAAKAWTDGKGVDVVADLVGGDATLEAIRATRPEGRVLILGFASGEIPTVPANRLLFGNVSVIGVGLGAFAVREPTVIQDAGEELSMQISEGLRPIVGGTFPLAEGRRALALLKERRASGKLVLTIEGADE